MSVVMVEGERFYDGLWKMIVILRARFPQL